MPCIVLAGLHSGTYDYYISFYQFTLKLFFNFPLNTQKMCSAAEH